MSKVKVNYNCQQCGYFSPKWLGKCPSCLGWNCFSEEKKLDFRVSSISALRDDLKVLGDISEPWVDLDQDQTKEEERLQTGIVELDQVLGGGIVTDSFILLGGDPGIGKSTLLLQMAQGLKKKYAHLKIFYVSGEESIQQIQSRAKRLGIESKGQIFLACETELEKAICSVKELKPQVLIMDSLQTFSSECVTSAPGSVSQVREVAARLMTLAKSARIAVWLVGHVTKEGSIGGPKTIEHIVDTVLYFEGERNDTYRLLRTVKNRFGSTRELGIFEMDSEGLREVKNPSALFLTERSQNVIGTAVGAILEGSRPILVELQALVSPSGLAIPRRTSVGIEHSRIALLAAILEKHMKLKLAQQDLFFNVAGGLRLDEPASDLAGIAAIWSSTMEISLPVDWVWIGEVGLTGEVRRTVQTEIRLNEAARLGFKAAVIPKGTSIHETRKMSRHHSLKLHFISNIQELPSFL